MVTTTRARGDCHKNNATSSTREDAVSRARAEKKEGKKKVDLGQKKGTLEREVVNEQEQEAPQPAVKENAAPQKITVSGISKGLRKMEFLGTRYPHEATTKELGIYDDVQNIFEYMELGKLMKMVYPTYKLPTVHFLATLKVHFYEQGEEAPEEDGDGFITFKLAKERHRMSFKKLEELYGFEPGQDREQEMDIKSSELEGLWEIIGTDAFAPSKMKGSQIRNPAVRYVHKALGHTFYARNESGKVNVKDLELLDIGLQFILEMLKNGQKMAGDTADTGIIVLLLQSFLQVRDRAVTLITQGKAHQGKVSIGGMITPILLASGTELNEPTADPLWIDIRYLNKIWFLRGEVDSKHIYKFAHRDLGEAMILLPCETLTTIREKSNIDFNPPLLTLYNQGGGAQQNQEGEAAIPMDDDEGGPSHFTANYGSERYFFEPFSTSRQSQALEKAHQHIKLLQRWSKWQDKTMRKLVKSVKVMKSQIRGLTTKLDGSSSAPQQNQGEGVAESHMALGISNSLHEPRLQPQEDPPRPSSCETRQRKRRAMRSPSPESSNPSYSLDEYDSSSF